MGARGPAPTPTAVLKLRGSWRADTRPGEPQPTRGRPRCPAWLSPLAKKLWREAAKQLEQMGVLTVADGNCLARYARLHARWILADKRIQTETGEPDELGEKSDAEGNYLGEVNRPEVDTIFRLETALQRLEDRLGLSPSARARLRSSDPDRSTDAAISSMLRVS